MLPELVEKANLFYLLHRIDLDLAEQIRRYGCRYCGSPLHYSNYQRKPRGGPDKLPDAYLTRHSLCCSASSCRRRVLPASCLFMGRRVYWGCVILVVMALRQQRPKGASIYKLQRLFKINYKTICRWIKYYRQVFPSTAQWRLLRGLVDPKLDDRRLPGSLLTYFLEQIGNEQQALVACLKFLSDGHAHDI